MKFFPKTCLIVSVLLTITCFANRDLNELLTQIEQDQSVDFSSVTQTWNDLTCKFYSSLARYYTLLDNPSAEKGELEKEECLLRQMYGAVFQNPGLFHRLISTCANSLDKGFLPIKRDLYVLRSIVRIYAEAGRTSENEKFVQQLSPFLKEEITFKEVCPDVAKKGSTNDVFSGKLRILIVNAYSDKEDKNSLIDELKSKRVDLICIEGLFSLKEAFLFYDQLKSKYSYFYRSELKDLVFLPNGFFIASKYPIADPKIILLNENDLLSFAVKGDKKIVHFYLLDLQFQKGESYAWERENIFEELIAKIERESNSMLCGNLMLPPSSYLTNQLMLQEMEHLIKGEKPTCFLLRPSNEQTNEVALKNVSCNFDNNNYTAVVTTLHFPSLPNKLLEVLQTGENNTSDVALCSANSASGVSGRIGVSGEIDSEGGGRASVEGKVEFDHESDEGSRFEGSLGVSGSLDMSGETSAEVFGSIAIDF